MRLAAALLLAALPAFAQPPSQFRSSAPITLGGADALNEVEIPVEAYRDARRDLADIRVFNNAGESVPYAWAGMPPPQLEATPPIELPIFPISRVEPAGGGASAEVSVRASDGTLVSVKSKGGAPEKGKVSPKAYLLDASKATEPMRALAFSWKAAPGSEVVNVTVESSDDLRAWSHVASSPIVGLEANGRVVAQPRVEFPSRKVKYFRVTWDAPSFELAEVRAEHEQRGVQPKRHSMTVKATPGANASEFTFDLGGRLPVESLRLVPGQPNSVLSTLIFTRDEEKDPWRPMASASFYRLDHGGKELQSPAIEIGRRPARYWLIRLAPGSSAGAPPTMEVAWKSPTLVFVAQGEGPFHLAFGNAQAPATALQLTALVPPAPQPLKIGRAHAGPVRAGPPPTRWENLVGEMNPRRIALWAILFAGVAALGFMAWRLSRQMKPPRAP